MITLALALCLQDPQTATWYWTAGYSPDFLLRTRPWQGVAVDSRGRVYTAHPRFTDANNRRCSMGQIRVFDAQGEPLAAFEANDLVTAGLALDERNERLLLASDQRHVGALDLKGGTITRSSASFAVKESGRCVGVSLGRGGHLFTADMGQSKVFRFYPGGGSSSFGSGPGDGEQGFNHLRRVVESPVDGTLFVLDASGVRAFTPAGRFLRRVASGNILAMGPDGRHLVGEGAELVLMDVEGRPLKKFPLASETLVDAALAKDGSFVVLPRGEEFCAAAYDAEGRLRWRRGSDFDRLSVTRKGEAWDVKLVTGLEQGLLTAAEAKAAGARPRTVSIFARAESGAWERVAVPPAGRALRFTTAAEPEGPGARIDVPPRR